MMKRLSFLLLFTIASCTPYWKDQPTDLHPFTPTVKLPSNAPLPPMDWQSHTVVGNVNVRLEPDLESRVIGVLYANSPVRADCDRSDGFCEVIGGFVIAPCLGVGEGVCR